MAVVLNDNNILHGDEQLENLTKILGQISASGYPSLIAEFHNSEKEFEIAKDNVKFMKQKIARLMKVALK